MTKDKNIPASKPGGRHMVAWAWAAPVVYEPQGNRTNKFRSPGGAISGTASMFDKIFRPSGARVFFGLGPGARKLTPGYHMSRSALDLAYLNLLSLDDAPQIPNHETSNAFFPFVTVRRCEYETTQGDATMTGTWRGSLWVADDGPLTYFLPAVDRRGNVSCRRFRVGRYLSLEHVSRYAVRMLA